MRTIARKGFRERVGSVPAAGAGEAEEDVTGGDVTLGSPPVAMPGLWDHIRGALVLPRIHGPLRRVVGVVSMRYHFFMAMTLRTTSSDDLLIEELAQRDGVSKHEAVLRAVRTAAARELHRREVASSADRVMDRYAHLIRRLGE